MAVAPLSAYTVDVLGGRSAEGLAAIKCVYLWLVVINMSVAHCVRSALRSALLAVFSSIITPSVDLIGVAAVNCIIALFALIGYM